MKTKTLWLILPIAVLLIAAVGNQYYETLPGLVIKHPATGATTGSWNGTNGDLYASGTATAAHFVGDGSGLTGLPITDSSALWVNSAGTVRLSDEFETNSHVWITPYGMSQPPLQLYPGMFSVSCISTNSDPSKIQSAMVIDFGYSNPPLTNQAYKTAGLTVVSAGLTNETDFSGALFYGAGNIGVFADQGNANVFAEHVGVDIGMFSYVYSAASMRVGLAGSVECLGGSSTNIGVSGIVLGDGKTGLISVGGYFETELGNGDDPAIESSVILLDSRDSGYPLITGRTNNGTTVFQVDATGSIASSGIVMANNLYSTNDCSALTFTDRSRSPTNTPEAYAIVASHRTKDGKVDHSALHAAAWGKTKTGASDPLSRDLGMVISAQQMVIQDLIARIDKLEKK